MADPIDDFWDGRLHGAKRECLRIVLKPGEQPQPGDVAARKENFADATGHSGIVTSVPNTGVVTTMAAHPTKIGTDMSFQPGSKEYSNHYQRYTGD